MYLIFVKSSTIPKSTIDKSIGIILKKENRKVLRKFELQPFFERIDRLCKHYKEEMPDEKPIFIKSKPIGENGDMMLFGCHHDIQLIKINSEPANLR